MEEWGGSRSASDSPQPEASQTLTPEPGTSALSEASDPNTNAPNKEKAGGPKTIRQENEELAKKNAPGLWYSFKGECYLHGTMDGEAMRKRIHEDIVYQVFELR